MEYSERIKQLADTIGYTIPEGVRFHKTGLELPGGLPYEDWQRVGMFIRIMDLAQQPNADVDELNHLRSQLLI